MPATSRLMPSQDFEYTPRGVTTMAKRYRTILHNTCLLKGQHPAGSDLARECPVNRAVTRRASRSRGTVQSGTPPQNDPGNRP